MLQLVKTQNFTDGKTVSFSNCGGGRINFNGETGKWISFEVKDTAFVMPWPQTSRKALADYEVEFDEL